MFKKTHSCSNKLMQLSKLLHSLQLKHAQTGISLNPPALLSDIQRAEAKIRLPLPGDLKELYSICNGFKIEKDLFYLEKADTLFRDDEYGYQGIILADYNTFTDVWAIRPLPDDKYEIFYNQDDNEIILTNSLYTFLERLIQGHLFEPGGLYDWHIERTDK